ncbi:MAG: RNA polymerase sigma factor [Caulobacteraceae bacterium]|nr:RNA polymerase sigma factor [Caulobacteraceae bacterium]
MTDDAPSSRGGVFARPEDTVATRRLRQELVAFLLRRGQSAEGAEDIVQEAFLRFHRAGNDVSDADARPLIFVIAKNLLKDHWKSASREQGRRAAVSPEDLETVGQAMADDAPAPDRGLLGREQLDQALAVIRALPPRTRDAFLLHRFEDLTYRQIADRLGVSVSMIEKHLAEALKRLKSARDD